MPRMAAMPISGLTQVIERARKVFNDSLKYDTSKSGEENGRFQFNRRRQRRPHRGRIFQWQFRRNAGA
ncbi:hypothetical protein MPL3356_40397 [Mesorhizobium plurifarium]|uniref:Uncharacterized protein n=1 Tax=Mesorhizobium plurifarium TaxID=69974 RepID=A0A090E227_MESPL|nr:hypothetical protein MPL3356_40397 [Mesorhizobium plurifarium]